MGKISIFLILIGMLIVFTPLTIAADTTNSSGFDNEANAFDGDIATYAENNTAFSGPGNLSLYLGVTFPIQTVLTITINATFYFTDLDGGDMNLTLQFLNATGWNDINLDTYTGTPTHTLQYNDTYSLNKDGVTGTRIKYAINDTSAGAHTVSAKLYELDRTTDAGITITLDSPTNGSLSAESNFDFNATHVPVSFNLTNATYYVWYPNSSEFNVTTVIVLGNSSNTTSLEIGDFSIGSYYWNTNTCGTNATHTLCNFATSNYTFSYGENITSLTNNTSSYQTKSELFAANITIPSTSVLSSGKLIYNGTSYVGTVTNTSNTKYYITRTIDIPSGANGATSYNWNYTIDSVELSSTTYSQTISVTSLGLCNATLTGPYLNITFADETDLSSINGTIDTSTFNYWLGNGASYKTLLFTNTTANDWYTFCASPNTTSYNNNISIQYASEGFPQRRWFSSTTLVNTSTDKTLYLLPTADGIYSVYQVQDTNQNPVSGVTVQVERQFSGVWTLIEQGSTDSAGAVTFWLNPNYDHRFTFTKSGFTSTTVTVRPSSSTYTLVLSQGPDDAVFNGTLADGVTWRIGPTATYLLNDTSYTFWFWVNSTSANIVSYRMELLDNDGTVISTTIGTTITGGNLTSTINVLSNKSIRGRYSIDTGDGLVIVDADSFWPVWEPIDIPERGTIKAFFSYLKGNNVFGEDEGRAEFSGALLFFLIIFIVMGLVSGQTGWDFATAGGGLLLIVPIVILASVAGFFDISYLSAADNSLTTAAFIQRYTVATIATLIGFGYLFNKLAEGRQ